VITVIHICSFMMNSNPRIPPIMMRAATKTSAASLVRKPPCHPNLVKTVAVANTAREARTVSQPTRSSQEMADGTRLPLTPNAARLKVIVGACPRLPDKETRPQNRNEMTMPTTPTATAWGNEIPKPRRKAP
jgi:hypothetical protein